MKIFSEEESGNYCVRLIELPYRIHGTVSMDETGFFNIYINSRGSYANQVEAFLHECEHAIKDHFHDNRDLLIIETEAKRYSYDTIRGLIRCSVKEKTVAGKRA